MRATYLENYGGYENLRHGQLPEPVAGQGEALVDIKAVGVNPVEPNMCAGKFKAAFPFTFPQVMGFDISGVVLSAPPGSAFSVGDEVYARLSSLTQGGYAERVATPVSLLAPKPKRLSHIEAASLPTVALTTWQALVVRAKLMPGERLMIQAGSGGIGSFAIQLAKHMGAVVTASASAGNQEWMRELGANHTIDYAAERFEEAGPFDVVYDGACGPLIGRGIDALSPGGRYVGIVNTADARAYREIGLSAEASEGAAASIQPFVAQAAARGAVFHGVLTLPDGAQLTEIGAIIDAGAIRATVTATYTLDALAAAYDALSAGHTRGKIVVTT